MAKTKFDYFVIGAGSGGTRTARIAAGLGARVGIAESTYFGGTCVNVGCVPKKLMTYAAQYSREFEDAAGYGWTVGARQHNWAHLIGNKNEEISRLNGIYDRMLRGAGVSIYNGYASFTGPNALLINDEEVEADKIVIAVGGKPFLPDVPGAREHAITSDDVFSLEQMPRRVMVVGAGYIAVEFAGIFHRLGADVTLTHRRAALLNDGFDQDICEALVAQMQVDGLSLNLENSVLSITKTESGLVCDMKNGAPVEVDCVLYATGRIPNTATLGLDKAGVAMTDRGAVIVNDEWQTSQPHIYAIGDVIDRVALTPVAIAEGHLLARRLFEGAEWRDIGYETVATAVFSTPPIGTVGLTEHAARAAYPGDIDIYKANFLAMKATLAGREERTLMKLVVQRSTDLVLGCHMLGQDSPEIIQGLSVALNAGATKTVFDRTIGIHPTSAEEFVTMRTKQPEPTDN